MQRERGNFCNSSITITGVVKLHYWLSSLRGSFHTCIPPPSSLSSPGVVLRSAGALPQCEPWMGCSGSREPSRVGTPSQYQTLPQMGQTGNCTDQNTVCCAPLLVHIPLLSHAVRITERERIGKTSQQYSQF